LQFHSDCSECELKSVLRLYNRRFVKLHFFKLFLFFKVEVFDVIFCVLELLANLIQGVPVVFFD